MRLFGFPLRISPWFVLLAVLIARPSGLTPHDLARVGVAVLVIGTGILWHELAHALVMRRFGFSPSIELWWLGGRTRWGAGPASPTPLQRVIVSAAGPFAGLFLGLIFVAIKLLLGPTVPQLAIYAFRLSFLVNIAWSLLNLLPMLPLDGGHVVYGFCDHVLKGRGARPAAMVSMVSSMVLFFVALAAEYIFPALLCGWAFLSGLRLFRWARQQTDQDWGGVADGHAGDAEQVFDEVAQLFAEPGAAERFVSAICLGQSMTFWANAAIQLERVVRRLPAERQPEAFEYLAWAQLLGGDLVAAERAVDAMSPTYRPSVLLEALMAFRETKFRDAIRLMQDLEVDGGLESRARLLSTAYVAVNEPWRVRDLLADSRLSRDTHHFVNAQLFFHADFISAAQVAANAFRTFHHPEDAYNAACSFARAGELTEALAWLERAVDGGYADVLQVDADDDLDAIRQMPGFKELRRRLGG